MNNLPLERIDDKNFKRARKINSLEILHAGDEDKIQELLESACVFMDRRTMKLFTDYISFQKNSPNNIIRDVYRNINSSFDLASRLIRKRPYVFMGAEDFTMLRTLEHVMYDFVRLNDPKPEDETMFREYISYEEMQLSALLLVASKTSFINDGNRHNEAIKGFGHIGSGVYVGMVGSRFERPDVMESQYIIPKGRVHMKPEIREMWERCLEINLSMRIDPSERMEDGESRYNGMDRLAYRKRMELIIRPFLIHAGNMPGSVGKKAYVHAIGSGLGVWSLRGHEDQMEYDLMYVYRKILGSISFGNIGVIDFAWFGNGNLVRQLFDNMTRNSDIKIFCSRNSPAGQDEYYSGIDKSRHLVVASFAWDSNAYVGNEYYVGMLSASGDPAAASHSVIADTLNPDRNSYMLENIIVY